MATTFTFMFIATRSTPINILSFIPYCPFPRRSNRVPRGGGEGAKVSDREFTNLRVANPHRHNHKSKIIRSFALCRHFGDVTGPRNGFREVGCFHCTRGRGKRFLRERIVDPIEKFLTIFHRDYLFSLKNKISATEF